MQVYDGMLIVSRPEAYIYSFFFSSSRHEMLLVLLCELFVAAMTDAGPALLPPNVSSSTCWGLFHAFTGGCRYGDARS